MHIDYRRICEDLHIASRESHHASLAMMWAHQGTALLSFVLISTALWLL